MPRRADGVWVDANGEVVYRSDPRDTGVDRTKATYRDGFWYDNVTGQKIPNTNDMPQRVPGTKGGAPGSTVWPDGTPVTPEQHAEINKQAGAGTGPGDLDPHIAAATGGLYPVLAALGIVPWAGSANEDPSTKPSEGAPDYGITGFADPSGATNNYLPENAPGAELPTAQADADRQRMADYLAQLEGQAKTGGGAWEGQLARATQQGTASATALGQSAAGVDPLAMKRTIGNATAGVEQRAAGQAETLRAQTQQQAQEQLAGIYSAQGSLDAQQAAEQAAARQGRREANQEITDRANKVNQGIYSGIGQGILSLFSNGGPVPGKAKVFGDDSANDTVPAMLSPGEIVLPRSVTNSENPEAAAAAFVQAVKEHHGAQRYDDGGQVPKDPWATKPDTNAGDALPVLANDSSVKQGGTSSGFGDFMGITTPQQAAGVRNGGLLDTTAYNASRDQTLGATQAFLDAYGGRGPSVAPQALRTGTDQNIAEAMAAQANARGGGRGAAAGMISGRAAEVGSDLGGKTAATTAEEATRGGQSYAAAIQRQRQMDLAFALAQQQAAWRNSMLNAGIGLAAQAQMRGVLGGVGQAFTAGAGALEDRLKDFEGFGADPDGAEASGDAWDSDISPGSAAGDWGSDSEGWDSGGGDSPNWASDSDTAYAAHGGEIRDRDFVRAAGYADGGGVPYPGFRGMIGEGETPEEAAIRLGGVYSPFGANTPPGYRGSVQPGEAPVDAAARLGGAPGPLEDQALGNALVSQYLSGGPAPAADPGPSNSPPGLVAQMAPNATAAPAGVPRPTPVARSAPDRRLIGSLDKPDAFALEQQAEMAKTSALEELGRAQAEAAIGAQKALERGAIEQKEAHARARMSADADMARILEARQAVSSMSDTVDPGRWWASRSTPGKIAAAIGLALGAIGAGNDGVNRAVGIIENAIGRDLEAQKAEHQIRMRKGQMAVDSATSIYTLKRQLAADDIAASDASVATALQIARNQVEVATARASSPLAKAQGQAVLAQLDQKRDAHDAATRQRIFDNRLKLEDAETRRLAAENRPTAGAAKTRSEVVAVEDRVKNINRSLDQMEAIIKKHGTMDFTGPTTELLEGAMTSYAVDMAKLRDPTSVAREGEVEMEKKALFRPGLRSWRTSNATALELIKTARENVAKRRDVAYEVRGLNPNEAEGGATGGGDSRRAEVEAWLAEHPNDPRAAKWRTALGGGP